MNPLPHLNAAADRRETVLRAATRHFAERGYAGCDVQSVADELGVGKGTVYRVFASKEVLFLASVERGMQMLMDVVNEATAETEGLETIRIGVRTYLEFFAEHAEVVELLILERAHFHDSIKPTYFERIDRELEPWRTLYEGLIETGAVRDMPVDRILDVICYTLYGAMFTNHLVGKRKSFAAQAEDILDVFFQGILQRQRPERGEA